MTGNIPGNTISVNNTLAGNVSKIGNKGGGAKVVLEIMYKVKFLNKVTLLVTMYLPIILSAW